MQRPSKPRVVIVGAGFGGLEAAKNLGERAGLRHGDRPDKLSSFSASSLPGGDGGAFAGRYRRARCAGFLSKYKNIEVILAEVQRSTSRPRIVRTGDGIHYDYLILATGARHSYFGHDEWEKLAPGLKSLEDAVEIRRRS